MIEHLELAPEVLKAFSAYAEKMEQLPHVNDVLVLRLFRDGSGTICASGYHKLVYVRFNDLEDLLRQLKQELDRAQHTTQNGA